MGWWAAAAPVLKAVAPYFGAALGAWSARSTNRATMSFQERMSSTAHQREVQDLRQAGLNPILSAGGQGASTPNPRLHVPLPAQAAASLGLVRAQTAKTNAEAVAIEADSQKRQVKSIGWRTVLDAVNALGLGNVEKKEILHELGAAVGKFGKTFGKRFGDWTSGVESMGVRFSAKSAIPAESETQRMIRAALLRIRSRKSKGKTGVPRQRKYSGDKKERMR